MTAKEALRRIEEIAHHAANGAHKRPGKAEPIGAFKADMRQIRDLARSAS